MKEEAIRNKAFLLFTGIKEWKPRNMRWKGRAILVGYEVCLEEVKYYVFIGKNGLGKQKGHKPTIVPIYCEVALAGGGSIVETMDNVLYSIILRLLPEFKRVQSYYRYASFNENELESAGQKLLDVLAMIIPPFK